MCVTVQAVERICGESVHKTGENGTSDVLGLSQFTESLKAEFRDILRDTLTTVDSLTLGLEASMERAADLCAERCEQKVRSQLNDMEKCQEKLLIQINETRPCTFFDLTNGDDCDDVSTSANSVSGSDSEDSIEFMYDQSLEVMNVREMDTVPLSEQSCPNDFVNLYNDIRGLKDLRDYTAKDLHSLFQDIQGLRKEMQNVKDNFQDVKASVPNVSQGPYWPTSKCPESIEVSPVQMRQRSLLPSVARSQGKKQWVAARSPGVCGDIGDRMRNKLLERQERAKAASQMGGRARRHSTGSDEKVQVYLSNVSKMGGKFLTQIS